MPLRHYAVVKGPYPRPIPAQPASLGQFCGRGPSGQGVRGIGPGGPNTAPFNDPVGVYVQADAAGAGGVQGTGGGSNGALSPGWS